MMYFIIAIMLFIVTPAYGYDKTCTFGLATDVPVIGDWNGDGRDEIGVKRGDKWYLDTDGDCKWTPEPPPQPPPNLQVIQYVHPATQVYKYQLPPGGIVQAVFEVPSHTQGGPPMLVKMEDYCDGAMTHKVDILVRYAGPKCDNIVPTVKDISDTWDFCRQYSAVDGCRLKWYNDKYQAPRRAGYYYDLTSTAFETVQIAGDPTAPNKDNPVGCYYLIVHNDDVVNTCPGLSLQDF